jgi:catechol 2,3-dioxygenase-like lactoylglutathione lyase family enzyme
MTARAFRAPGTRIPLRPSDLDRSLRFYRDVLGLAIYREFGPAAIPARSSSPTRDCPVRPGIGLPGTAPADTSGSTRAPTR